MTKKERVKAAIRLENAESVPSCFSMHFLPAAGGTDEAVLAHLDFFAATDTDVLKIMNENLVPDMGPIEVPADWNSIPVLTQKAPFIQAQLELTQRVLEKVEPGAYTMGTLHGIVASSIHPIERRYGYEPVRELLCAHLRQNKSPVLDAMKRIADALCHLARGYAELGLNSIYLASLGGEARYFTDEEFAEYVQPLDIQIMQAGRQAGADIFLHACKDGLVMERYLPYAPFTDAVNWGLYGNDCSLERGRELFPGLTLMGGMSNLPGGPLACGNAEDIRNEVAGVLTRAGRNGFILGADCTLPAVTPRENIRVAAAAARNG